MHVTSRVFFAPFDRLKLNNGLISPDKLKGNTLMRKREINREEE